MALSTLQIIKARAPHLEGHVQLPALIELAEGEIRADLYKSQRAHAVALLVLHWITLDARNGAVGPIISESEGQLSRSFAAQKGADDLSSTSWGEQLLALKKRVILPFRNSLVCP